MDKTKNSVLLHEVIKDNAEKLPSKECIINASEILTYKELYEKQHEIAQFLLNRFEEKSRIALLLDNSAEFILSFYGVSSAGMISVPMDPNMHIKNLVYMFNDCNVKCAIIPSRHLNKFVENVEKFNDLNTLIVVGEYEGDYITIKIIDFWEMFSNQNEKHKKSLISENDIATILYTTGTTGPKKGVMLSHHNLLSASKNINEFMQIGEWAREVIPIPLTHSFGLARTRCVFDVGGTVILEKGFLFPNKILENIKKYQANGLSSVPTGFAILLDRFEPLMRKYAKDLRYIEIGSAFMREEHKKKLREICPNTRICMHYGLTEASRSTFIEFHSEKEYLNTIGKPSPNVEIKIVDKDNNELSNNMVGEILVNGEMVMKGYWNKSETTKESLTDGWLHTGDIGKKDESGYIYLLGRTTDIINVGGMKIAPGEVEEVLLRYNGTIEAAVIGTPSKDRSDEVVKAFIVCKDNNVNVKDIQKFCLRELESYKAPQIIEIVDQLPKTGSGKIKRHVLREKELGRIE